MGRWSRDAPLHGRRRSVRGAGLETLRFSAGGVRSGTSTGGLRRAGFDERDSVGDVGLAEFGRGRRLAGFHPRGLAGSGSGGGWSRYGAWAPTRPTAGGWAGDSALFHVKHHVIGGGWLTGLALEGDGPRRRCTGGSPLRRAGEGWRGNHGNRHRGTGHRPQVTASTNSRRTRRPEGVAEAMNVRAKGRERDQAGLTLLAPAVVRTGMRSLDVRSQSYRTRDGASSPPSCLSVMASTGAAGSPGRSGGVAGTSNNERTPTEHVGYEAWSAATFGARASTTAPAAAWNRVRFVHRRTVRRTPAAAFANVLAQARRCGRESTRSHWV